MRSSYIAMEALAWYVLLPLSFLSLSPALFKVSTSWGVLRHYWVVVKLVINVLASGILLLYTQTLGSLADSARRSEGSPSAAVHDPSPLLHCIGALLLLTCAAALSVYKPRGRTRYGWRKQHELAGA